MKLNPEKNDKVKIIFKNINIIEDGIVLYWSDTRAVLQKENSKNLLIINNPEDNILAVQIIVEEKDLLAVAVPDELKPDKYYRDENLRALSLVKLRQKQAEEERKNARDLLTTFKPSGLPETNYNPPNPFNLNKHGIPIKTQPIPLDTREKAKLYSERFKEKRKND